MKSAEEYADDLRTGCCRMEGGTLRVNNDAVVSLMRRVQSDVIRAAAEICGTNAAMFENGSCPEPKAMAGGAAQCVVDILSLLPEASK